MERKQNQSNGLRSDNLAERLVSDKAGRRRKRAEDIISGRGITVAADRLSKKEARSELKFTHGVCDQCLIKWKKGEMEDNS